MPILKRQIKDLGKQGLRRLFETGQRVGVDILPRHFYSEVPDVKALREADSWKLPRSMFGIQGIEPSEQLAFVAQCCTPTVVERLKRADIHEHACKENGEVGFGPTEADFLYAFIFSRRPKRIIQVGCGVSTALILLAAAESNYEPELVCIDPYPTEYLRYAHSAGKLTLVEKPAQDVPLELLTEMGHEGLLFVDSSHTVKPGSEVNRVILEVLPRLVSNTYVHFHDIYFPYDYQRGLMTDDLFFCNESVLLQAFLTNNPRYKIRASLSMLHYACANELQSFLPNYEPADNEFGLKRTEGHFPASTYLQVIA